MPLDELNAWLLADCMFEWDNRSTIYLINGGMNKWGLYGKPVLDQEFAILVSIGNWKPCPM
jgi:hypothetical protein